MLDMPELRWIQREHREWAERNFGPTTPERGSDALLGVIEEVGELAHAHLKAKQGIRGTPEEHYAAKIDAIGDIVIFLMDYCNREDIDLYDAIELTWAEVKQRDWKAHPTTGLAGVAKGETVEALEERDEALRLLR